MAVHPAIAFAWVAWILTWAMAVFVYAAAPSRPANRRLAIIFFVHGVAIAQWVLIPLFPSGRAGTAFGILNYWALLIVPFLYLWFLSTLDAPLARMWRGRAAKAGLVLGAVALLTPLYVARDRFVGPLQPWFAGGTVPSLTGLTLVLFELTTLLFLLAFAIAFQAWRRAPRGSPERDQAFWFMLAFGLHDVYYCYRILVLMAFVQAHTAIPGGWVEPTILYGRPASLIAWVVLLAYGMLRHQVLGLDLKLKATLRNTTVAAAIAVPAFIAGEALEAVADVDGFWLGLGVAGLATLALHPIQRGATRLADRLMPDVQDTQEYRAGRADAIYRMAWDSVREDGQVGEREQRMLDRLGAKLGLSAQQRLRLQS